MLMLILDAQTAAAVAGETSGGAVLEPRPLEGGDFALPERILDDPHHARHHTLLATMPTRDSTECAWLPEEET